MLDRLLALQPLIGQTDIIQLEHQEIDLYAKLEYKNLTGSMKVRPAYYMLKKAIEEGRINRETTVIESSSGNFAIALATLCKQIGIPFVPVIDPNINPTYETLLDMMSYRVEKVTERDETGGFLLTRIAKINEMLDQDDNVFWTNQYGNYDSVLAHYHGTGEEIAQSFAELHYAFIGVGSGGTIAGVSKRLKEQFPAIRIIAVDSVGSVIFGHQPEKRYIPGIGSSLVPENLQHACIDEVVMVPEWQAIGGCHALFENHGILAGGSSGSVYVAINEYFKGKTFKQNPNVVFLCADSGTAYVDTIYNKKWAHEFVNQHRLTHV